MFGYVKAAKPDLRVREYEAYKGVYCTLCKTLGKRYGILSRFTLNYDFVFLALIRLSCENDGGMKFQKCRCSFNPFVRCNKLCTSSNAIDYSADVAMLLFYRKKKDNISDEGFFKRTLCRLLLPFAKAKYKKAAKLRPDLSQKIDSLMDEQALCEAEKKPSLDKCCHPSAASLGEIMSYDTENEGQRRILYRTGYCVGKWVYLADALDDFDEDAKKGRFNPLFSKFGGDYDFAAKSALAEMNVCISEAISAVQLLDFKNFGEIINNILYKGLPSVQQTIVKSRKEKNHE